MRRLDVNFAARAGRSRWAGHILLGVALALSLDAAHSYRELRASIELSEAQLARAAPRGAPARKVAPEEVAAVSETLERLALPWDRLFGALESATNDRVALLGIEPDPKAGTVIISGDSKDYLSALSYMLDLGRGEALSRVQLVRHELKTSDAQGAVAFAISASWHGGRP